MDHEWLVKAPIQYGRRSQNQTYTMVFSELPEAQFGQAIVVKCQSDISSSSDLIREAEWLWSAEDNKVPSLCCTLPKQSISGTWGCVALLGNPQSEIPQKLLGDWAKLVTGHYAGNQRRLVDDRGTLQIPWPNLSSDSSGVPMDLLLATSNDRDATFPTVREIADAWKQHPEVDYFCSNRKHKIDTFQDSEIEKLLGGKSG